MRAKPIPINTPARPVQTCKRAVLAEHESAVALAFRSARVLESPNVARGAMFGGFAAGPADMLRLARNVLGLAAAFGLMCGLAYAAAILGGSNPSINIGVFFAAAGIVYTMVILFALHR